jgi:hypothetical protein
MVIRNRMTAEELDYRGYVCRSIARLKGGPKRLTAWPCPPDHFPALLVYEDAHVSIFADQRLPSLYVEMLTPHHNPVLAINSLARVYRTHGEWTLIEPHIEKIAVLDRPCCDFEAVEFVLRWAQWFYDHTNTFSGSIGRSLSYLWPAILKGEKIEVTKQQSVVQLLLRNNISADDPIWGYIDVMEGR